MAKQTIEIEVPDGTIGKVVNTTYHNGREFSLRIAAEDIPLKTKWRPPTKMDLLGVDSIVARVRDDPNGGWGYDHIAAVISDTRHPPLFISTVTTWKFAEIEVPIDEQPPREAWVRYDKDEDDPWGSAWPTKADARRYGGIEVIHMIEIRKPTA